MALVLADRVKESTTTTGTGTVTLLGAAPGFQSFAVIGNANTTYYAIAGQTTSEWEVGIGTYTASGTLLARTTVLSNSAGTQPSALSFSAGTKDVFVTYPAEKSINEDASGNVGIGTTSPTQKLTLSNGTFHINGTSTFVSNVEIGRVGGDNNMGFATGGTERMRITSAGSVGIGTSSPTSKLVVGDNASTTAKPTVAITDTTSGASITLRGQSPILSFDVTSAGVPKILMDGAGIEFKTGTLDAQGDVDLKIDSSGNVGIGTSSPGSLLQVEGAISMRGVADVRLTLGSAGSVNANTSNYIRAATDLLIYNTASGRHSWEIGGTERMRIDSSGNVGIGNASPSFKLDVAGTGRIQGIAGINGGTPASDFALNVNTSTGVTGGVVCFNSGSTVSTTLSSLASQGDLRVREAFPLVFGTNNTERMRITSTGDVGIGTDSPAFTSGSGLEVQRAADATVRVERTGATISTGEFVASSGLVKIGATGGVPFTLFTDNTERARISSVGGFSVGTTSDPGAGAIYATGNITAYFSDDRFKTNLGNIPDALAKVQTLNGFYYEANELAQSYGYEKKLEVGVSAQQVEAVMPEVVAPAPIDENYLTVRYERLVPLLIEAIKELNAKVTALEQVVAKSTQG